MEALASCGMVMIGRWRTSSHKSVEHLKSRCPIGIQYEIPQEWRTKRDVVYAFVIDNVVRYVGETSAGMTYRFDGYRYGNPLVTDTDNRVKVAITDALVAGQSVEIWGHTPLAILTLPNNQVLQVPASKPLEEHLIGVLRPDLNVKNLRLGQPEPEAESS